MDEVIKDLPKVESLNADTYYIETKDLNKAAYYLCTPKFEFADVRTHSNSDALFFIFKYNGPSTECRDEILKYMNSQARVEPLLYMQKLNILRDMIFKQFGIVRKGS